MGIGWHLELSSCGTILSGNGKESFPHLSQLNETSPIRTRCYKFDTTGNALNWNQISKLKSGGIQHLLYKRKINVFLEINQILFQRR